MPHGKKEQHSRSYSRSLHIHQGWCVCSHSQSTGMPFWAGLALKAIVIPLRRKLGRLCKPQFLG